MANYDDHPERVIEELAARGISTANPGFFDQPAFRAAEEGDPEYLCNYARFIDARHYTPEYLDRARREIPEIAEPLHQALKRDGRLGACIDLSMVLSRILEREGFWNYMVSGCLTQTFPSKYGFPPRYIWAVDRGNAKAPHVWVVAPPFLVVDLTVSMQRGNSRSKALLPK